VQLLLLQLLVLLCGCQEAAPDSCCNLHPLKGAGLNLCNIVEVEEPAAAQQRDGGSNISTGTKSACDWGMRR
jgi:hypothetical protein